MVLSMDKTIDTIRVKAEFEDTVCLFFGDSATGKTYLFRKIKAYCMVSDMSVVSIDDVGLATDAETLVRLCKGKDVVIFDRADLYLTTEIVKGVLENGAKLVLISVKDRCLLKLENYGVYNINFTGTELTTKRLRR